MFPAVIEASASVDFIYVMHRLPRQRNRFISIGSQLPQPYHKTHCSLWLVIRRVLLSSVFRHHVVQ